MSLLLFAFLLRHFEIIRRGRQNGDVSGLVYTLLMLSLPNYTSARYSSVLLLLGGGYTIGATSPEYRTSNTNIFGRLLFSAGFLKLIADLYKGTPLPTGGAG